MADNRPAVLHRHEAEVEFSRIVAFTDGVFAIAITLLVLALEIPSGSDLSDELSAHGAEFFAYAISFAVLARLWLAHHRFYGSVARFDGRLIALNFVYLAFIALVPFTSEVLGEYSDDSLGVALYAAVLTAISLAFIAQIVYAYRADLVKPEAREFEARFAGRANYLVALVFGISIPAAFISPELTPFIWVALFVVGRQVGDRLAGKRAPR